MNLAGFAGWQTTWSELLVASVRTPLYGLFQHPPRTKLAALGAPVWLGARMYDERDRRMTSLMQDTAWLTRVV